jgi:hypothetical protein
MAPKDLSGDLKILRKTPWPHLAPRLLEETNISWKKVTDDEISVTDCETAKKHRSLQQKIKDYFRYGKRTNVKTQYQSMSISFPGIIVKIKVYREFLLKVKRYSVFKFWNICSIAMVEK